MSGQKSQQETIMSAGALLFLSLLVIGLIAEVRGAQHQMKLLKRAQPSPTATQQQPPAAAAELEHNAEPKASSMISNNPSLVQGEPKELAVIAHAVKKTEETTGVEKSTDQQKKVIPGYPGSIDPMKVEETEVDRKGYQEEWDTEWKLGAPRKPSLPVGGQNSTEAEKSSSVGGPKGGVLAAILPSLPAVLLLFWTAAQ